MQIRKLRKKVRRFKFVFLSIAIILVFVGLAYLSLHSGALQVTDIDVQSLGVHTDAYIAERIADVALGESKVRAVLGEDNILFWLFLSERKILASNTLPLVKNLNINTNLFKKIVTISLDEKEMEGVYCSRQCYVFDKDGRIFLEAPKVRGSLILRIDDSEKRPVALGEKFLPEEAWTKNLFSVVQSAKNKGLNIEYVRIRSLSQREWDMQLFEGPLMQFSFEHKPAEMEKVLDTLMGKVDIYDLRYLDFRVEGRIYYE